MTLLDKLKSARDAIQSFRPEQAEAMLRDIETDHPPETLAPEEARRVATELRAIAMMAEAARDGVAQAQQQIKQLLALSQSLGTYDRDGTRQVQELAPKPVRKF